LPANSQINIKGGRINRSHAGEESQGKRGRGKEAGEKRQAKRSREEPGKIARGKGG
jgi:hypothetical protein